MPSTRFSQLVAAHLVGVRLQLAAALACIAGSTVTALVAPWPLKLVFDHVLLGKPLPETLGILGGLVQPASAGALLLLAATTVLLAFLGGFFAYWQLFITSRIGYEIVSMLRTHLLEHVQRLSLSFHTRTRTGELMSKLTTDTNTLRDVYSEHLVAFASQLLTVGGMLAVMLALDWVLAVIVAGVFPVVAFLLFRILRRVRRSAKAQRANEGRLAAHLGEILGAVSLVQVFGRERFERERFESESAQSMEESIRAARMEAATTRLVEIASALATALVVAVGGHRVLRGVMTPGDLLVFTAYVASMYKPVKTMARLSTRMSKASASMERISEVLQVEPEIEDAPDAIEARELSGEVVFDNVTFGYEPGRSVLRNVSFRVPAGGRVALVGASGAGKSTIVSLLLRLYDPQGGRVLVDGIDIRRYRRESLRRAIGVVLQDTVVFGSSVRENIAYGKPDATDAEIEQAARAVNAHEFIIALPGSYDQVLGERGSTVSGGQRQRICLARALVKRPSILVMDEPTSAVDADAQDAIHEAVQRVQDGKTTLLIAHQRSSVEDADWILVLKDGRIVEEGTHQSLVRRGAHYCDLFDVREPLAAMFRHDVPSSEPVAMSS
jgi:ATP-binding cassette subfamily B protein/subfamily B ATP-binding cassette protein MsbA